MEKINNTKKTNIRIFLSRPNPFTKNQKYFINRLKEELLKEKIESITLQAKDYSPYESLTILDESIKRCYGMIILAFGHTYVESGITKKGSEKDESFYEANEQSINGIWITSSFCQIEGAFAISNNIPIMVLKQKGLKIDGILKEDEKIISMPEFSLDSIEKIDEYFETILIEKIQCWEKDLNTLFHRIESQMV